MSFAFKATPAPIRRCQEGLGQRRRLVIVRSKPLNLKYDSGRIEAVRMVMVLFRYFNFGEAKVEVLNLVLKQD